MQHLINQAARRQTKRPQHKVRAPRYGPHVYDSIVYKSFAGSHLGDVWASTSYILKNGGQLVQSRRSITHKMKECADLMEHDRPMIFTKRAPTEQLGSWVFKEKYLPTKQRWDPTENWIAYQFDGRSHHHKNLSRNQEHEILSAIRRRGFKPVRLGGHISLMECVDILSRSHMFVGVDSGMSHIAHSVRIPMILFANGASLDWIQQFHENKPCTFMLPESFITSPIFDLDAVA
jgi:hypothetical protein